MDKWRSIKRDRISEQDLAVTIRTKNRDDGSDIDMIDLLHLNTPGSEIAVLPLPHGKAKSLRDHKPYTHYCR